MMNGQSRTADRERIDRLAKATGRKFWEIQDEQDEKDYRPTKQAKLWSENSGQHYPGWADEPSTQPKPTKVTIPKIKRDVVVGPRGERKVMNDDKYAAELDAQRKRAQALAYLEQGDDGIPDDALRGRAAEKRKREKTSQLERTRDNTLKQVSGRERDDAYKELQHKLLGVQAQLRKAGSLLVRQEPTMMVPSAAPLVAAALPPGWSSHVHSSSNQIYYVKDSTGERRWDPPTRAGDGGDGATRVVQPKPQPSMHPALSAASKKKAKQIDPMDPLGRSGGKYSDGLHHKGERMADSTASGPLWQQRPYPAPGSVLRMSGPGVREGGSIGPQRPGPQRAHPAGARPPQARMMPPQARRRRPPPPPPPRRKPSGPSRPPGLGPKKGGDLPPGLGRR